MLVRDGAAARRLGVLLLAVLLVGCGDQLLGPPGAPNDALLPISRGTVGSVTIDGAPSGSLAVGGTVQLGATVRSTTGKTVSWPVKWRSADTTVARVSAAGLVTAVRTGQAAIIAGTGRVADTANVAVVAAPATLSLSSPFPALYVGQPLPLVATARDAGGSPITGLHLAWKSSDAGKAAVDSAGTVTGVSAGAVTVTVSAGAKSASASLTVADRPVAEWSQAGMWPTFQGNARHTGHVPVTADPLAFRERWVEIITPGLPLNAVAAADGKVFVSTGFHYNEQSLAAFDIHTAGRLWTKEFGIVQAVHPPAYGEGRVYVTTGGHWDSFLWGFDAATGDVEMKSSYHNQWFRYFAPVVADGMVHMAGGYNGGMFAFRTSDGGHAWFANTGQYEAWTPAVAGGQVFAYGASSTPALSVVTASTGALAYSIPDPGYTWSPFAGNATPVLGSADNVLTAQGNRLVSFDLAGRRVGWEVAGQFSAVTVAEGVLYTVNDGRVEARRESDGAFLWSWIPPEGRVAGQTVATRNLLFVSTSENVYAVDLGARRHTWSHPAGGHLSLAGEGILLVAQENGSLTAIDLK
jgi:PQQ-like domain/Bacterial Ig-like domain (group 2)